MQPERPLRLPAVLALSTALVPGLLPAQAPDPVVPTRGWSTVRTDLEISVEPGAAGPSLRVAGTIRLALTAAEPSPGPTLALNSRGRQMVFERGECKGGEVRLNLPHPERSTMTLAQVRFPQPKQPGSEIELRFDCAMQQAGRQLAVGAGMALASWVEAWYPMPIPPAGASLGYASKAKGTTRFVLPEGWSAVTNGHLVSRGAEDGKVVEVWHTDRALSRSFAAGPFRTAVHEAEGVTARLYLLSDAAGDPEAHVQALFRAIRAMEQRFGPYPFKTFSIAEVPASLGSFGASSEQGFILVKPFFLRVKGGNLPLFAHEAAHAWWGNTVGSGGPAALFCSESLAQYGAVVAIGILEGEAAATGFLRFSRAGYVMNQCARGYFDLVRRGHDVPLNRISTGLRQGHQLSDAKGHWVYHMLRRRVGDEVFFATLRRLIARFDGKSMTMDDVRAAFAAAAPQARLGVFFAQWLDRTGAPELEAEVVRRDGRNTLAIRQVQGGDPFDLDLDLVLSPEEGAAIRTRVHLERAEQSFPLAHPGPIRGVEVDPDHRLLIWHPEYGPAPSKAGKDR